MFSQRVFMDVFMGICDEQFKETNYTAVAQPTLSEPMVLLCEMAVWLSEVTNLLFEIGKMGAA